jgi:hypothetical protein
LKNALLKKDSSEISSILRQFKTPTGGANFPALFSVPVGERLPAMAKNNFNEALTIVSAAVTSAMSLLNLRLPMTDDQVIDLADALLDSAAEDNLALEDLVLFLQQLTRGKYNPLYESMDLAKFMEKFEIYRETRWKAVLKYNENKHLEYKSLGDPTRTTKPETAFDEHLQSYSNKLQAKNDEIKLLRRERNEPM